MADELVHYAVSGGTATITLDSPHNRNALSARLRGQLSDSLDKAIGDEAVRVIVLGHRGPVFCSGMDLKEAQGAGEQSQGVQEFPSILERIWTSPKPVVAALSGPARAGGVGLVAAADIAVAADTATFAFTEVRIGVIPAIISVTVLPRLNARAAHELFLTGEKFDAKRAAEIGLINAAVPEKDLAAEVERYVAALALGGPSALAATKQLLQGETGTAMPETFATMLATSARFFASEEGQEGITAFAQKRTPNWVPAD
ncbi:enoyl-CoA hydratase [Prauserella marina]|uniref:Methylglutaconyl-CoA hydratase n=1 Tax=Prauserella marina TaxID=530584 RepID=A0A222VME9_9PSEU|nr:enoyl-CoA hydratase family protein [Prauserella marina]ASR35096.1 enoyl-CoA hydratase [Prauserella marina]PWV85152.1 methylglutaconyl-CoA hydratase [Prauserella marina]SDC03612.1 methylglutaconyl-CoA hydratase [Prauserella marina]